MKLSEADKLLDRVGTAPRHVRKAIKEEMERQTYREQTEKQFWNTKEFAAWLDRSERYVIVHRHEMPCAPREGRFWHFDKEIAFRRKAAGKSQIQKKGEY
jgi:hypothetical protein